MSLSLDYSAMVTTCLLSWLLLTSNILAPMAFSQAGTMTSQHPAGHQKLTKKVVIKRISDEPKLSLDSSYHHYHYPTQEVNNTNTTNLTELNPEPKQIHHHSHSHYEIPVIPPAPKSDVSRVFYNWFPDTMARVDSIITVNIPIPFCQFENSPCKPRLACFDKVDLFT